MKCARLTRRTIKNVWPGASNSCPRRYVCPEHPAPLLLPLSAGCLPESGLAQALDCCWHACVAKKHWQHYAAHLPARLPTHDHCWLAGLLATQWLEEFKGTIDQNEDGVVTLAEMTDMFHGARARQLQQNPTGVLTKSTSGPSANAASHSHADIHPSTCRCSLLLAVLSRASECCPTAHPLLPSPSDNVQGGKRTRAISSS